VSGGEHRSSPRNKVQATSWQVTLYSAERRLASPRTRLADGQDPLVLRSAPLVGPARTQADPLASRTAETDHPRVLAVLKYLDDRG